MSELRYPSRRVCVVLLTGLGDVVQGLPIVNALKDDDPSRHITWVVQPMPAPIIRPHPSVDEVVIYRKNDGVRGVLALRRELARRKFDLTLNLNVYFKSVWPTILSGAPHRLGFDRARTFEGVWLASNHHLEPRPRAHTQENFLEFVEHLGLPVPPKVEYRIPITPEERAAQAEFFARFDGRPVVSLVPASAIHRKDWRADRYARLVDALEHDLGFRTLLIGGPGEREVRIAREITDLASAKPAWAMGDPIRHMIWQIEGSRLIIAPDTGPLHLARALEVPGIGLFGHTNPWRCGPYGDPYQELWVDRYTDPGAAPDPSQRLPKQGRMDQITVDDVLAKVELAMRRHGVPDRRERD